MKMTASQEGHIRSEIKLVDAKLNALAPSEKVGDNVVYTALWFYRHTLMRELVAAGKKGF
jgi:hypothetical protein